MDALELLRELGHVEPADHAVIDSALQQLTDAVGQDSAHTPLRRLIRRRFILTTAAVSVLAAAGTAAVVGAVGHSGSAVPPALAPPVGAGHGWPPRATPAAGTVTAILTAFNASRNDILMVTKTMSGDDGTLGKTVIWLSPAEPGPGTAVRSRILSFSLAGTRQADQALAYSAVATPSATAGTGCDAIFRRPRVTFAPAAGVRGILTFVSYPSQAWGKAAVSVQAATLPTTAGLQGCLKDGQWHVVADGVLAGAKVTELATANGYERLWVSAATYLPVRLVSADPNVDTITFNFSFLPPTAANQVALTPLIPQGFAKQSP